MQHSKISRQCLHKIQQLGRIVFKASEKKTMACLLYLVVLLYL